MATYTAPRIVGSSVPVYFTTSTSGSPLYYLTDSQMPDWANDTGDSNNTWIAVSYNSAGGYAKRLKIDTAWATNPSTSWFGTAIMSKNTSNVKKWVINLQFALLRLGKLSGYSDVDGVFGQKTENAVKAFQSWTGITADGVVGNTTKERLVYELNGLG